jgi:predicted tellurium resistance membrane protein TerC
MFDSLLTPDGLLSLLSLTLMEIVLGIDNIIFITILVGKLSESERERGRLMSLVAALLLRLVLLGGIVWIATLNTPLFDIFGVKLTGKNLIMLIGGIFLMFKAIAELHGKLEGEKEGGIEVKTTSFVQVILQSTLLSLVFSVDSIITAIGLASDIVVMAAAIVLSTLTMALFAKPIGDFVDKHPTMKILGLSMLLLIGITLIAEGVHFEVPKGYMYFAIAFSLFVESINIRIGKKATLIERTIRSEKAATQKP